MDNCLKDEVINLLRNETGKHYHILHYVKPPSYKIENEKQVKLTNQEKFDYQRSLYCEMFNIILSIFKNENIYSERSIILNRSHIGEFVYANIYRNSSDKELKYLFTLERIFLETLDSEVNVKLIILTDSNYKQLSIREDGHSFSGGKLENLKKEFNRFKMYFENTNIKDKKFIDLNDYYISESLIDINTLKNVIL
jgi:hypothetical protein